MKHSLLAETLRWIFIGVWVALMLGMAGAPGCSVFAQTTPAGDPSLLPTPAIYLDPSAELAEQRVPTLRPSFHSLRT